MSANRIVFFYLNAFLMAIAMTMGILTEPIYALRQFDASPLMLGLLGTSGAGAYSFCAFFAGRIVDRFGRRRWMVFGASSHVVLSLVLPSCPALWLFVVTAVLKFCLMGFFWPTLSSLLSLTTPRRSLSRAVGFFNISWCSGGVTGSTLCGWLYDHIGPTAPFYGSALLAGMVLLMISVLPIERTPADDSGAESPHPNGQRLLWQARILMMLCFFTNSLFVYIFPKLASLPELNLSAEVISRLHGLRVTFTLAIFILMALTARWHFRQWPLFICFAMLAASMVGMLGGRSAWHFVPSYIMAGTALGCGYALSIYYAMLSPKLKGAAMGTHESILSFGGMLGPIIGGTIVQLTGRPTDPFLWTVPVVLLVALVCLRLVRPRSAQSRSIPTG